ncbi:hypothetical protein [Endozoicomonas sp.]|uniref:hypothetical protein n=1 Tax=Endozoicomonas sp. TaxID=1892382 RepID=UPI00383AA668
MLISSNRNESLAQRFEDNHMPLGVAVHSRSGGQELLHAESFQKMTYERLWQRSTKKPTNALL